MQSTKDHEAFGYLQACFVSLSKWKFSTEYHHSDLIAINRANYLEFVSRHASDVSQIFCKKLLASISALHPFPSNTNVTKVYENSSPASFHSILCVVHKIPFNSVCSKSRGRVQILIYKSINHRTIWQEKKTHVTYCFQVA